MADTISNVFSAGPSIVSPSTSGIATKFVHPAVELPVIPSAPAALVDSSRATPTIATFDLESCEEIPYTAMDQCLDLDENKENNVDLSDKDMINYMQLFEKNITKGSMFQGCTINNPVFNITIQK